MLANFCLELSLCLAAKLEFTGPSNLAHSSGEVWAFLLLVASLVSVPLSPLPSVVGVGCFEYQ